MKKQEEYLVALEQFEMALQAIGAAGHNYAMATKREMELETERPRIKSEAISRLMALPDPQKDGKLYSATAAEAVVMNDTVYALHRADQAQAAANTIVARAAFEAAKLTAQGSLERLRVASSAMMTPRDVLVLPDGV